MINLLLLSTVASADQVNNVDVTATIQSIAQALAEGKKVVAVSGAILILVYLFRKYFFDKLGLGSGILPYISIILGVIMGLLSNIVAGVSPGEAAKIALISGPSASILWNSIFKLVMNKPEPKPEEIKPQ